MPGLGIVGTQRHHSSNPQTFSEHLFRVKHIGDASWKKMMTVLNMTEKGKPRTKFPAIPGPAIVRPKKKPGKFLEELEFELTLLRETCKH